MLTLRLQRIGKIKSPSYRLIVSEKARDTHGRILEFLGQYNPVRNPKIISFNAERITYWLSKGAETSNTVHNLLVSQGILSGASKKKTVRLSNKRRGKIDSMKKATEEAAKKAEETRAAAEEAAKKAATSSETPA